MLTVEQYISQMKKKDKLDEFNFKNHAENMTAIIKYVMGYFNDYLNPEVYDYENIKMEQTILKIEKEIQAAFPESIDFIIEYYKTNKTRIDKVLKPWLKGVKYMHLFYCYDDYKKAVSEFCNSAKMKNTGIEQYKDELIILAQEVKENEDEKPSISDFKHLDNSLVSWIKDTYREYGVNLFQFASNISWSYYEKYVESIYNRQSECFYHINRYNHRYNSNPFDIDEIYDENKHRPFINGHKGELEMLIMYSWIFDDVEDTDYWPEYVNLCASTGRVSIVKNINILLPVKNKDVNYPKDIKCTMVFTETNSGFLSLNPGGPYILRLNYNKDKDIIWKCEKELRTTINNLNDTFTKYGAPYSLEILSPLRSPTYNEEEFFSQYRVFEKSMKKYTGMKISLVNGPHRHTSKPKYIMQTTEDIVSIRNIVKEMKFKLKFTIDFPKLFKRKSHRSEFENDFNSLSEMRSSIVGIHLSSIFNRSCISRIRHNEDKIYLHKFDYPEIPDFLGYLSALFNDSQPRYFVPEEINSADVLEELVDDLLRGGFSFCDQE